MSIMPCGGDGFVMVAGIAGDPACFLCQHHDGNGGNCGPIPAALPEHMKARNIYRGSDGRWYHPDGRVVDRKERRKAGVR